MQIIQTLEDLFSELANTVSRRALDADPVLATQLRELEGSRIEIDCTMPARVWHLAINNGAMELIPGQAENPNVVISGTAYNLLGWLLRQDDAQLTIDGDTTLLQEVLALLQRYNPDFAHALTQVLGPDLAQRLVGGAEVGVQGLQSLFQALASGVEKQTSQRFVTRDHLDDLLEGIDELRMQVDRLAARVRNREQQQ
ncbi:MAG: alkyl sulfatase C-terminal domain-containing protein [Pseudomonadota bacterium]